MNTKQEEGQAMVEFALTLPILVLLLCIIIDSGWIFSRQILVNNACREAARYTAIHLNDSVSNDDQGDASILVNKELPGFSSPAVVLSYPDVSSVEIHVTVSVPILTGVTATILRNSSIAINADSVMKIEP